AAGQVAMKTHAEIQQSADPPVHGHRALVGSADSTNQPQQRGLSGAVPADHADHGTWRDLEGDVAEPPEPTNRRGAVQAPDDRLLDRSRSIGAVSPEPFSEANRGDGVPHPTTRR